MGGEGARVRGGREVRREGKMTKVKLLLCNGKGKRKAKDK